MGEKPTIQISNIVQRPKTISILYSYSFRTQWVLLLLLSVMMTHFIHIIKHNLENEWKRDEKNGNERECRSVKTDESELPTSQVLLASIMVNYTRNTQYHDGLFSGWLVRLLSKQKWKKMDFSNILLRKKNERKFIFCEIKLFFSSFLFIQISIFPTNSGDISLNLLSSRVQSYQIRINTQTCAWKLDVPREKN